MADELFNFIFVTMFVLCAHTSCI